MTLKMPPKMSNCTVTLPWARSTKWGKTAAKNTSDFGFKIPTVKPCRMTCTFEGRNSSRLAIAAACAWRCRIAPTPSHNKYRPPAICNVIENVLE